MFRSAEGTLGVDDPVVTEEDSEPGGEAAWLDERCEVAVDLELAFLERGLESGDELAAEDASEHLDREEEGATGGDPTGVIGSEAASSDDAVDMRVVLQPLVPGMEHAEEADLGAEMPRIASDLQQRGGTGAEQQAIDQPLVLERERSQFPRQREHGMHIAGGQQLAFALLEPADAGVALALRAVPVAARVRGDGSMSAAEALFAMAAERGGAATHDGGQHLLMLPVDPSATALEEALPCVANDVGHLQRRPAYTLRIASPGVPSCSMSSGLAVALRCRLERWR